MSSLNSRWKSNKPEFIVIYGRRRVGKSELIDRFLNKKRGLRLLAREEARELQLRRFSVEVADYFNDDFLRKTGFSDWDSFFEYLYQKSDERIIIAIDEFPYLVKEDNALPSILQSFWDLKLKETKIFLILCGSSVRMMESMVMEYNSPLYGRRTGQVLLRPLHFIHIYDYIKDIKKAVNYYSVYGGIPAYITSLNVSQSIEESITENIFRKDSYLFRDIEFVLRSELSEPRYYFSILLSISNGNHSQGLITNDTGLSKGIVNKYLSTLIDLDLVKRKVPATVSKRCHRGLYYIKDNLFLFWFRFAYPNIMLIERDLGDAAVKNQVMPYFSDYTGLRFEEIVEDIFLSVNGRDVLPFLFTGYGSWWHKGEEIDGIYYSDSEDKILFCEYKWQDNVQADILLQKLKEKSQKVSWKKENRTEYFCLVARSFDSQDRHTPAFKTSGKKEINNNTVLLDINDIEALCRKASE
ncbi:ATP-binding protein [Methanoplanus endosymbiosus]|uniref:ATP-binding protein n=1 Tax=Methanoplanus endosymbiosus TaxID=33865 RepID=A0A9E7PP83_9EURY|nr:ATP-binding protein [Methanoplanus endosymbiosus]UUX92516.1 ATP-binding protein [Methanoplanus endosymbiosus]